MKLKKGQIIKATSNSGNTLHFLMLAVKKKHVKVYCVEDARTAIAKHDNFVFYDVKSIEVVSDVPTKKTKKETS